MQLHHTPQHKHLCYWHHRDSWCYKNLRSITKEPGAFIPRHQSLWNGSKLATKPIVSHSVLLHKQGLNVQLQFAPSSLQEIACRGTNWSVPEPNEASSWREKRTKTGGLRVNNTHSWRKASEYKNAKNRRPERAVRWHHTKDWIIVEVFKYRTDLFKMPCHEFDKDYGQATMNKKKNHVCHSVVENPKLLMGCHPCPPTRLQLERNCAICNNKSIRRDCQSPKCQNQPSIPQDSAIDCLLAGC